MTPFPIVRNPAYMRKHHFAAWQAMCKWKRSTGCSPQLRKLSLTEVARDFIRDNREALVAGEALRRAIRDTTSANIIAAYRAMGNFAGATFKDTP